MSSENVFFFKILRAATAVALLTKPVRKQATQQDALVHTGTNRDE